MSNQLITIEKGKYRALLERVFNLVQTKDGALLTIVVRDKIKNIANQIDSHDSVDSLIRRFEDLELLGDYVKLVTTDNQDCDKEIKEEVEKEMVDGPWNERP